MAWVNLEEGIAEEFEGFAYDAFYEVQVRLWERKQLKLETRREYDRQWRARHAERLAELKKKAHARAAERERKARNIEHYRAYGRAQYQKHKAKRLAQQAQARAANLELFRARGRAKYKAKKEREGESK